MVLIQMLIVIILIVFLISLINVANRVMILEDMFLDLLKALAGNSEEKSPFVTIDDSKDVIGSDTPLYLKMGVYLVLIALAVFVVVIFYKFIG